MSEYLALPDGAGCFPQDFSGPVVLRIPALAPRLTPTGLSPAVALLSRQLRLRLVASGTASGAGRSYNPAGALTPAVWAAPRSLATTWGITRRPKVALLFSLPPGTEMFQFPGFASCSYVLTTR
jgi:hypothetical protein